jgi:hypothetical protein
VNGRPATANLAFRLLRVSLAATTYFTEPLPVPLAPPVIVTQGGAPVTVHGQPCAAFTVIDPELLAELKICRPGVSRQVQAGA